MKIVGCFFILFLGTINLNAQDCNPCIGIHKVQVISAINESDTLSQLNAGTQIGLYVKIDDAEIVRLDPDYTRLLEFTDDKRTNLLRKGQVIENYLQDYFTNRDSISRWTNGINLATTHLSADKHILAINIESLAKPTNGAQTLTLEGQLGVLVSSEITEAVLVRNVNLSRENPTVIPVKEGAITFTYVRTEDSETSSNHIFSYSSDIPVVDLSESASASSSENLAQGEVSVSTLDNIQFMVEVPKPELREIPFTLSFGLGL